MENYGHLGELVLDVYIFLMLFNATELLATCGTLTLANSL